MTTPRTFGVVDYVLFVLMLLVSMGIGVYYAIQGRRASANSTSDYLVARSKVSLVPVALSLMASFMSAITIIGMPAEIFGNGVEYTMYVFGISLAIVVVSVTFVPLLHPMKFISSFEYIEKRFDSRAAKSVGALILALSQMIYIGTAALAPSTALQAVTGFPVWATILVTVGVATAYTFLGGIRAVVWTDAFQSVVMVAGLLAIIIKGSMELGGMDKVWDLNYKWGRINFIDTDPDPTSRHTLWCLLIGGCFNWCGVYGANQASIQRYCALPTVGKARLSVLLNILLLLILFTIVGLSGVVIFAYYANRGCDPVSAGLVANRNQIVPWFVMEVVGYPGVPGLFLSSLFSGALSSISSSLSALAAVGLQDFVKPVFGTRLSETKTTIISKILVVIFGVVGMCIAFLLRTLGGTVLQISLTFTASALSPILGIFILAAAVPVANWIGTIVGSLVGLIIPMWLGIGQYVMKLPKATLEMPNYACNTTISLANITTTTVIPKEIEGLETIYTISYIWMPMLGTLTTLLIGTIVSLLTGGWRQQVDKQHLFPFLRGCLGSSATELFLKWSEESSTSPNTTSGEYQVRQGLSTSCLMTAGLHSSSSQCSASTPSQNTSPLCKSPPVL